MVTHAKQKQQAESQLTVKEADQRDGHGAKPEGA